MREFNKKCIYSIKDPHCLYQTSPDEFIIIQYNFHTASRYY